MIIMADDMSTIKAGVNGVMEDAPAPNENIYSGTGMDNSAPMQETSPSYESAMQEAQPQEYGNADTNKIQEIAEAIVNEKWQELLSSVGNIAVWKEKVDTNIISIKQEIVRINERFDNLQNAILGKIRDYDNDMKNVSTEMKALEKVFEKIIEPLTSNVKELNRITKELKEIR